MMFVIVSTVGMALNTMPGLKVIDQNSEPQNNPLLEIIEAICIAWFTMEFFIRSRLPSDYSRDIDWILI